MGIPLSADNRPSCAHELPAKFGPEANQASIGLGSKVGLAVHSASNPSR
jgi:hypothetical protein